MNGRLKRHEFFAALFWVINSNEAHQEYTPAQKNNFDGHATGFLSTAAEIKKLKKTLRPAMTAIPNPD